MITVYGIHHLCHHSIPLESLLPVLLLSATSQSRLWIGCTSEWIQSIKLGVHDIQPCLTRRPNAHLTWFLVCIYAMTTHVLDMIDHESLYQISIV